MAARALTLGFGKASYVQACNFDLGLEIPAHQIWESTFYLSNCGHVSFAKIQFFGSLCELQKDLGQQAWRPMTDLVNSHLAAMVAMQVEGPVLKSHQ